MKSKGPRRYSQGKTSQRGAEPLGDSDRHPLPSILGQHTPVPPTPKLIMEHGSIQNDRSSKRHNSHYRGPMFSKYNLRHGAGHKHGWLLPKQMPTRSAQSSGPRSSNGFQSPKCFFQDPTPGDKLQARLLDFSSSAIHKAVYGAVYNEYSCKRVVCLSVATRTRIVNSVGSSHFCVQKIDQHTCQVAASL